MNTISGLLGAGAITRGVGQVLAAARGANPSAAGRINAKSDRDTLEISPEAEAQLAAAARSPTSVRLDEVRAEYETGLRELEQRLVGLIKEADIEIGDGFRARDNCKWPCSSRRASRARMRLSNCLPITPTCAISSSGSISNRDSYLEHRAARIPTQQQSVVAEHPRMRLTMSATGLQANSN